MKNLKLFTSRKLSDIERDYNAWSLGEAKKCPVTSVTLTAVEKPNVVKVKDREVAKVGTHIEYILVVTYDAVK